MNFPKIQEKLIVQTLNDEILIYDTENNKAYCLNSTAREVFNACDGKMSFADIDLPEDIIYLALDELKKQNLIADDYASPFAGMSRREVIRKVGLASMIALPVISGIIAPSAIHAASGCVNPGGAAPGQSAGGFGCDTSTTACAASCNNSTVRAFCCNGRVTATANSICGFQSCCVCVP